MTFELHPVIMLDIFSMKSAGNSINDNYKNVSVGDNLGLKAAKKYAQEEKDINALIKLYSELVNKDAKEIREMVMELQLMDSSLGKIMLPIANSAGKASGGGGGGSFGGGKSGGRSSGRSGGGTW